jgi:hypothetical protein
MQAPHITPRWLTLEATSKYVGVSIRTLQNWDKAGHLRTANVSPMGTRGRRLIDRQALDLFIEGFVGAAPSQIVMNKGRKEVAQ